MSGVAVCIVGLLRSLPEVALSMQRFLVEPLNADVFISGPVGAVGDWVSAIQHFPSLVSLKLEKENVTQFLENSRVWDGGWKAATRIKGNWLGCLEGESADMRRSGSGLCQMYSHKQCLSMITDWEQRRGLEYERVVYSRADFLWLAPHVPLSFLPNGEMWIVDGEDNGGINDRHWVMPRSLAAKLLNSWDRLVEGQLARLFENLGLWGLSTEVYFHYLMVGSGLDAYIRRLPALAYVVCSNFHNRKRIDMTAVSLNDSRRLGEVDVRCRPGGPKYKHEYNNAKEVADCGGGHFWSMKNIWDCWCADKEKAGMLVYSEYRLCVRAKLLSQRYTSNIEYIG